MPRALRLSCASPSDPRRLALARMSPTRAAGRRSPAARPRSHSRRVARAAVQPWTRLTDEELLHLRVSALRLSISRSQLAGHVRQLSADLERRGLKVRPHVWLSEEWFSPDGVPGIAMPFYLAHPRLDRVRGGVAEGGQG